jgi:hypothetical protein
MSNPQSGDVGTFEVGTVAVPTARITEDVTGVGEMVFDPDVADVANCA